MSLALTIGLLLAAGIYLVLQRGMMRIVFGFVLLTHAINLLIIAAGGVARRDAPFFGTDTSNAADPLPQAFVLSCTRTFLVWTVMAVFSGLRSSASSYAQLCCLFGFGADRWTRQAC